MPIKRLQFILGEAPSAVADVLQPYADIADNHLKIKLPNDSEIDMCAVTKAQIEAVLTGVIASHSHSGGSDGEVAVVATQDTPNATVNLADAVGLTFAALANSTYIIEAYLVWATTSTGVGIKVSATASGSPTIVAGRFAADAANGTPDSSSYNANDVVVTTSASPFTTNNFGYMSGILKTAGSASTWQLRFAAETTGTITIKIGSTIRYRKVG